MRRPYWIIIFLFLLAADIIAMQLNEPLWEKIFKPLLMPVLFIYFLTETKGKQAAAFANGTAGVPARSLQPADSLLRWILLALFFSWAGDVLLLFQDKDPLFFLTGLSAFLLAHIFYIIFFHKIRVMENVRARPVFMVLLVIYYAALIWWLNPYLGDMKLPVRIYGIVISFMFMLALHMLYLRNKLAGRCMMGGALLFVISDSLLAINKFYQPFELAGMLIMLTYGFAQLLIVTGAISYIRKQTTS